MPSFVLVANIATSAWLGDTFYFSVSGFPIEITDAQVAPMSELPVEEV